MGAATVRSHELGEENRAPTIEAIRAHRADLGIAWDGDFDRCFLFDEGGAFIAGHGFAPEKKIASAATLSKLWDGADRRQPKPPSLSGSPD